ncbi:M28 family peptidase [Pontibacter beigongshangensis]|uniref:M28 family peptidase n=1 Tax=Pontibacter beigongshangensis TaxID=2574733 RepID=UPI001F50D3C4|nr:M28 family peptidase [Pontibacter beigongshangensis]
MKYLLLCLLLLPGLTGKLWAAKLPATDTLRLKQHITALTSTAAPRNYKNLADLNQAAAYIKSEFEQLEGQVEEQTYRVGQQEYRNIILSVGPADAPRLIVGAHYDVCGEQAGADDNASGVAGLLELARLLHQQPLRHRIDLVAYTLEEPPYFRTEHMGSFVHAQSLQQAQAEVAGMVSLEMIGYFSDQKNSQRYPFKPMKLVYGSRGNYISVVQKFGNGKFGRQFKRQFRAEAPLRVKSVRAPAFVPGIDFSDHRNYWHFGYSALMVTDTAFYRNSNYHKPTDTADTLDLLRMGQVVDGVYKAILKLSKKT